MAKVQVYITGNTDGGPVTAGAIACRAATVREAVACAAQTAALPWLPEKTFGRAAPVSVFVNGANLMLKDAALVNLADGDVILLECPATDT